MNLKIIISLIFLFSFLNQLTAQCWKEVYQSPADYPRTYAIDYNGNIWGWGNNNYGWLGDSTKNDILIPTIISNDGDWKELFVHSSSVFGIKDNGTLWGWGWHHGEYLGLKDNYEENIIYPTKISDDNDWIKVYPSATKVYGLKSDSTVYIWGQGYSEPTYFKKINYAKDIHFDMSILLLKNDSTLWGMGMNDQYELGQDNSNFYYDDFIKISDKTDWVFISSSISTKTSFAIDSNGHLWGWGKNNLGQLGDGTTNTGTRIKKIDSSSVKWEIIFQNGGTTTFGIKEDGSLWGWGYNIGGQIGVGHTSNVLEPTQISNTKDWLKIYPGSSNSTFGIKVDGTLWAWGASSTGQIGNDRLIPKQVGNDKDWDDVQMTYSSYKAVKNDGSLWGWGDNSWYQLGNGQTNDETIPVLIGDLCIGSVNSIIENKIDYALFPNPVVNELLISGEKNIEKIYITNVLGQIKNEFKVNTNSVNLNLMDYPSGIYYVTIIINESSIMHKTFIKQ